LSYNNTYTNKPFERASKTAHTNIINDNDVKKFISSCHFPPHANDINSADFLMQTLAELKENPIKYIFAVDGGYTNEIIRQQFPSATFAFFQFGALCFTYQDLIEIEHKPFIDPNDMSKLQKIQRFKLPIPTKGITLKSEKDLVSSVRKAIFEFFVNQPERNGFISALAWLLFEKYNPNSTDVTWTLASCPICDEKNIPIDYKLIENDYTFICTSKLCNGKIYLTDVFRLHEVIDNELGASGILGYLTTAVEHLITVYLIKQIISIKSDLLNETLFIRDGPLGFFGQTANMHKPMRKLIGYLQKHYNIFLVGIEKSGTFVEHAEQVSELFKANQYAVLGNNYIYKYILPEKSETNKPYASTSYFGHKVLFKSKDNNMYVATIACPDLFVEPEASDLLNVEVLLKNISALKCDLYSSSIIPVVLANKLVSLASHPSSDLLRAFAQNSIG
jgi:hypothetical protein